MNLLKLITPINLAEEEVSFFNSASYHPFFRYDWDQETIKLWIEKAPKYSKLAAAVMNQDVEMITSCGQELFQVDWSEPLLHQAKLTVLEPLETVEKTNVDALAAAQRNALKQMGLDYEVVISDEEGFVARPEHKRKRIVISKSVSLHFFSVESSLRHDMTHIVRYINGEHNQIAWSRDYLPTEEGLASFMQDTGGDEPNNSAFQHAAEYAVTQVTRQGSLREAVEYLISIGFPQKLAWQRAVRHKFGFADTSRPGDIMKPAMYFAHSQKIQQLTQDDRLRLFVGKIAIDDLSKYPEYVGRWSKKELTDFFFGI